MTCKYKDKDTLQRLYWEKDLTQSEIAERFDVTPQTILKWMKRRGISTRQGYTNNTGASHQNPDRLRELYHDEGLSLRETAARLGCDQRTVRTWMERYGIQTRDRLEVLRTHGARFRTNHSGYEEWRGSGNEHIRVHRLFAIAHGANPYDIFGGYEAHHKNKNPFDNRESNIEVLDKSEHMLKHGYEQSNSKEGVKNIRDEKWLQKKYHGEKLSQRQISKLTGVSESVVRTWLEKHGIEKRDVGTLVSEGKLRQAEKGDLR